MIDRSYGVLIVLGYAMLHCLWAALLLYDQMASWTTALFPVWHFFGAATVGVLLTSSFVAVASLFIRDYMVRLVCLTLQQFVTFLSAGGAIAAIYWGQYADGTLVPKVQIAADQMAYIVGAILHAVALLLIATRK